MIKHNPIGDINKVCGVYSKKDGVPIKYVCTTSLSEDGVTSYDVFYRDTPHPEFGNKYFGIYYDNSGLVFIRNADVVEKLTFGLIEDSDGTLHYSSDRWDYKKLSNGYMIDGGRSYIKSGAHPVYTYIIRDGEMVEGNHEQEK